MPVITTDELISILVVIIIKFGYSHLYSEILFL